MRIRSIKPVFWRDRDLAKAGDEARLFYIGLWMQADDAGYFRWNVDEIGADLYPYLSDRMRVRKIERARAAIDALPGTPRIVVMPCGHALLTRFTAHQKAGGGSRITTFASQHERCPRIVPTNTDMSEVVDRDRDYGQGLRTGRDGDSRTAREGLAPPEWRDLGEKLGRRKGLQA